MLYFHISTLIRNTNFVYRVQFSDPPAQAIEEENTGEARECIIGGDVETSQKGIQSKEVIKISQFNNHHEHIMARGPFLDNSITLQFHFNLIRFSLLQHNTCHKDENGLAPSVMCY